MTTTAHSQPLRFAFKRRSVVRLPSLTLLPPILPRSKRAVFTTTTYPRSLAPGCMGYFDHQQTPPPLSRMRDGRALLAPVRHAPPFPRSNVRRRGCFSHHRPPLPRSNADGRAFCPPPHSIDTTLRFTPPPLFPRCRGRYYSP